MKGVAWGLVIEYKHSMVYVKVDCCTDVYNSCSEFRSLWPGSERIDLNYRPFPRLQRWHNPGILTFTPISRAIAVALEFVILATFIYTIQKFITLPLFIGTRDRDRPSNKACSDVSLFCHLVLDSIRKMTHH